jgi:hypothetical protein
MRYIKEIDTYRAKISKKVQLLIIFFTIRKWQLKTTMLKDKNIDDTNCQKGIRTVK